MLNTCLLPAPRPFPTISVHIRQNGYDIPGESWLKQRPSACKSLRENEKQRGSFHQCMFILLAWLYSLKVTWLWLFVPSLCYYTPEQSPEVNLHSMREALTAGTIWLQSSFIKAFLFRAYQRFHCSLSPSFKSHLPCSISNSLLSHIILLSSPVLSLQSISLVLFK